MRPRRRKHRREDKHEVEEQQGAEAIQQSADLMDEQTDAEAVVSHDPYYTTGSPWWTKHELEDIDDIADIAEAKDEEGYFYFDGDQVEAEDSAGESSKAEADLAAAGDAATAEAEAQVQQQQQQQEHYVEKVPDDDDDEDDDDDGDDFEGGNPQRASPLPKSRPPTSKVPSVARFGAAPDSVREEPKLRSTPNVDSAAFCSKGSPTLLSRAMGSAATATAAV